MIKKIYINLKNYNIISFKKKILFINNYKKNYILNKKLKLIIIINNINLFINLKYFILKFIYKIKSNFIIFIIK